jgi:putative transposase
VERPRHWLRLVNQPQSEPEAAALQTSLRRGSPFGSAEWVKRTAGKLGLARTLRPRGRPKKPAAALSPRYRQQLERRGADKSR